MIPAGILDMGTAERGFLNCISRSVTGLLVAATREIKSLQRHHFPRQVNHSIRALLPLAMNWSTAPLPAPKLPSDAAPSWLPLTCEEETPGLGTGRVV